ncbi:MAG: nitronate monooxygenase, partial [Lachnospiraceae bacterium]|nr:nitronate monooxygenase [Lachnospiraceae bacterium]
MVTIKPLKIGDLVARVPVIQGGMGVGVSLSSLAGAVAKEGGIGVISTAQIGYREPDFDTDPIGANLRAIQSEIRKAREIAQGGVLGVNIMVATRKYEEYVKAAVSAGIDMIISGAGLPMDLPKIVGAAKTKLAPIVSSVKSVQVIMRYWWKKYSRLPDAVVIEGPLAGGHLGFHREQLDDIEGLHYDDEIEAIIEHVNTAASEHDT